MTGRQEHRKLNASQIMGLAAGETGRLPIGPDEAADYFAGLSYLAAEHGYGLQSASAKKTEINPNVAFGHNQGYAVYKKLAELGMGTQLKPDQLADRSIATAAQFYKTPVPFDARLAAHALRGRILAEEIREFE